MLKLICTFIVFIVVVGLLYSNNVESRSLDEKLAALPASRLHRLRFGADQTNSDSSNEDDRAEYIHTKRKSELLSSLYGLPYILVNRRNTN